MDVFADPPPVIMELEFFLGADLIDREEADRDGGCPARFPPTLDFFFLFFLEQNTLHMNFNKLLFLNLAF